MLRKIIFFFTILIVTLWNIKVQDVNAIVVVSFKPLGFIASAITDGVTNIKVLLPDGISEHDYFLRPSDIEYIRNAELVVWTSPKMEVFMTKLRKKLTVQKQVVIAELNNVIAFLEKNIKNNNKDYLSKRVNVNNHHYSGYDMHLWLSPEVAWCSAVAIHDKLVKILPQSKNKLDANLKDFEIQLAKTNKQVSSKLNLLKGKGYFTFHDAYGYYERYYGLTPLGYFIINSEIQPSVQRLYEIRMQLLKQKAICVFVEPQFRPSIIKAIAKGIPVRIGIVDSLGTNIQLSKQSYLIFLNQLANQYTSCLNGNGKVSMCNK